MPDTPPRNTRAIRALPSLALAVVIAVTLATTGGPLATTAAAAPAGRSQAPADTTGPVVIMHTSLGDVRLMLLPAKAPQTVAHFLSLVAGRFYDGTIFHRVTPELIQGGGYTEAMTAKEISVELPNESAGAPANQRGTVAIVHRPGLPHTATGEFFINVTDNLYLDYRNPTPGGYGWAVFARVVDGMAVVDSIAAVPTGGVGPLLRDCPLSPVRIDSMREVDGGG